jgi:PAS domain S-box-containing protein
MLFRIKYPLKFLILTGLIWSGGVSQALSAEKVTLQLRWDHQFGFAGYYAAQWQGFYKEAGLDVKILSAFEPDGKFHKATREVAEGRAEFSVGGVDIVEARDKGAPLVVVSSIYQQSPVAFYAKVGTKLTGPVDLTKLRVGTLGPGGIANVELRAMLRAENIDPELVKTTRFKEKLGLFDLAKGNVDVASGYTISAGWVAKELGLDLVRLRASTYGVDFYGSAIFSNQKFVENNPQVVEKFVAASLKGWEYALTHGEEIADRIASQFKRKIPLKDKKGFNRFQIKPVSELILYPVVELGHTNPERWRRMHAALKDSGLINGNFDAGTFIFDPETRKRERDKQVVQNIIWLLIASVITGIFVWILTLWRSLARRQHAEKELKIAHENMEQKVKERTAKLAISEDRFKEAQSIAHVGSWSRNLETGEYSWSDEEYKIFGLNPDGPAVTYDAFINIVHPDDRQSVLAAHKVYNYNIEYRIVRPSGEIRFIQSHGAVVRDANGEPKRMLGTVLDQTERKQTEQQYHEVLKNLADGAITINTSGIIEYVNPMTEKMFGYSVDEMVGQNVSMLMPSPDCQNHDKYLSNYLETGISKIMGVGRQVNAQRKDGTIFPVDLNINETTVEGKTTFFGTARDMTERAKTEEDLIQAKLDAEASNRVKSEFLANMSHELRTPLNAIIGFSDVMKSESFGTLENQKYKEYINDINKSGTHLLELINDILDVSVIEAGKLELNESEVFLEEAVESCLHLIKSRAEIGNVNLVNSVNGDIPVIHADPLRIKQILVNLLSNAVKFTPDGGTVTISTEIADDNSALIVVSDTGIGMDGADIAMAMEKFGQTERGDLMQAGEGTGLGLPLTNGFVEAHGGTLKINSKVNKGTTVVVRIPEERVLKLAPDQR